ncbi:MAG: hypothetical protein SangKO_078790 [Sandaracinaceae bacterium]
MGGRRHNAIELHQALHGYRDGHELLATSDDAISARGRRTMLALSDLSGDGVTSSFSQYLTGYPIAQEGKYAFACTWYADEMRRPGCVWTHTLMIAFSDLAAIEDLGDLRAHFRRPTSSKHFGTYERQIRHQFGHGPSEVNVDAPLAAAVISALYGDQRPTLVPAASTNEHEELVLRIWSQQWPRLRRSFTFCTGSLSPRSLDKQPLDLQVVPFGRVRNALRGSRERYCLVESSASVARHAVDGSAPGQWLAAAAGDLTQPTSGLRTFLRRFGADVEGNRESFRKLTECFVAVARHRATGGSPDELLTAVARALPAEDQGAMLKATLIGRADSDSAPPLVQLDEDGLLRWLMASDDARAFELSDSNLLARVGELLRPGSSEFDPAILDWLLQARDVLNRRGTLCLTELLRGIDLDQLRKLFMEDRALFVRLVRSAPELTTRLNVWTQPREFQRACLEALSSGISRDEKSAVVRAAMDAPRPPPASDLLEALSDEIIDDLLNAALGSGLGSTPAQPLPGWRTALSKSSDRVCTWFAGLGAEQLPRAALVVANLLGPRHPDLRRLGAAPLLRATRWEDSGLSRNDRVDLAGFMLAYALGSKDGGELAASSFPVVHEAAMRDALPQRAWRWLAPDMPTGNSWFGLYDWDRAEKLRRALVDAFIRHGWDAAHLATAAVNKDTRRRLHGYCRQSTSGRALLRASGLE